MTREQRRRRVVIGVDTHKHIHVAVALDHETPTALHRGMRRALGPIGSPEPVQVLVRAAVPGVVHE